MLLLLAPITPHITDSLWRDLYGKKSIHGEVFPKASWSKSYARYTKPLTEFNGEIWKKKKERGLSLSSPIDAEIPPVLRTFAEDLRAMHKISAS